MKKIALVVGVVLVVVAGWTLHLMWVAGQLKTIEPHFAGTCRQVDGVVGGEDITIHPETGVAYVSATDRRSARAGGPCSGHLMSLEGARLVDLVSAPDFCPHGISLWVEPSGSDVLFAVNHSGGRHTVEIYDIQGEGLSHRRTVADPLLRSPNDIVGVGRDRFYVTNDHRYSPGLRRSLEDYLRLPLGSVVYFDGQGFSEVASGVAYPNGIQTSPDGSRLYVAATIGRGLSVFDRSAGTGELTLARTIPLETGLDNIEVTADGTLWIAAHPQLLTFVAHAGDPSTPSPSQVLRVDPDTLRAEEVYLDRGEAISASSVAAVSGDRMLIGAVFDDRILDCRLEGR